MNKVQRRAHVEPPCPDCGSRVVPIWSDTRDRSEAQPDWRVVARECSNQRCPRRNHVNR